MKYSVTFKNQIVALKTLFYCTILFFGLGCVLYNINGFEINEDTVIYFFIFYFVSIAPALFLQVEYYLINKNDIVDIDTLNETLMFNGQNPIPFSTIKKIILVMSPVLYRKSYIGYTPFDDYHYAIIEIKDNQQFIFTCLMASDVQGVMEKITGIIIEKRRRIIPSTLWFDNEAADWWW